MQLGIVAIPTILHMTVGPPMALTVFSTLTAEPAFRRQVADIRPIDPEAAGAAAH